MRTRPFLPLQMILFGNRFRIRRQHHKRLRNQLAMNRRKKRNPARRNL